MVGMGDVPGGVFYAIANDVSADGGTIVGEARTQGGASDEAFLWTESGGWVQPDPLHGLDFASSLHAVSADGSRAVGYGQGGTMIWDAAHGMRSVAELLVQEHGLDLTGWTLGTAYGVSDDGTVIGGVGLNPTGQTEGWIATLPPAPTHAAVPAEAVPGAAGVSLTVRGPNPFVHRIEMELALAAGSRVRAAVFAVDGRRVRTLLDAARPAGTHALVWDGNDRGGRPVPGGVYWVRVEADGAAASRKVVRRAP
jgi:hypothetical protein